MYILYILYNPHTTNASAATAQAPTSPTLPTSPTPTLFFLVDTLVQYTTTLQRLYYHPSFGHRFGHGPPVAPFVLPPKKQFMLICMVTFLLLRATQPNYTNSKQCHRIQHKTLIILKSKCLKNMEFWDVRKVCIFENVFCVLGVSCTKNCYL